MKRRNATRSALFTSIISLLLCVSMLVGTTFAWFTDTVESGVNVINAGNLDVELYHDNGAEKVDGQTDLFNLDEIEDQHDLWEPGAVAYENFIVKNEGNLALKYQLAMNFTNATKNAKGRTLADVLKVAVVEGGFNGTREDAKKLDYSKFSLSTFTLSGKLEEHNDSKTYGIVIYWEPSNNDNDYNMKNVEKNADGSAVNALKIDLGVSLFATQLEHEDDSYDNTYDKDASLEIPEIKVETPTADALLAALAAGETAVLTADTALDDGDFIIPEGVTAAIDLNGNTLTLGANGGIQATGNLIVTGTGNINVTSGEGGTYAGVMVDEGATVELGEGVTINTPSNTIGVWVLGDLIVDGATINAAAGSHGIFTHESGETSITINSGSVTGEGDAIYIGYNVHAKIVIAEEANVGKIVGGYGGTTADITYYGAIAPNIADNAAETINLYNIREAADDMELDAAIAAGANEIILAGGDYTADLYSVGDRDTLIITGQGADTKLAFNNLQVRASQFKNLTIENCTIERMPNKNWGHLVFGSSNNADGVYTISNCIFNGVGSQGIYINENVSGATYNIENCVFDGNFGSEGAITIQNNENVNVNVNVNGCTFNNIPETSHNIYVHYNYAGLNLKVDGKDYVANSAQLESAINNGATDITLANGNYAMPGTSNDVTISGTKETEITVSGTPSGSNVTFNGVTVKGSGYATGVNAATVTYNGATIVGDMCLYKEKVVFNYCTFELNNQYIWTYGAAEVEFNNCTFNTTGKAILIYNEGDGPSKVTVKGCTFNATTGAKASAINNQNCAAIEIDNFQSSGTGVAHELITEGNTYSENFSGEWRMKNYVAGNAVTVNGVEYTQIAIDGKLMTIDTDRNVTVAE